MDEPRKGQAFAPMAGRVISGTKSGRFESHCAIGESGKVR